MERSRTETVHTLYTTPGYGILAEGDVTIHAYWVCCDHHCAFHNPSKHPLNDAPTILRFDKNLLVERQCKHGTGHPDPDSLDYLDPYGDLMLGVHGCDGCCA